MTNGELTVGEMRQAMAGQPATALVKFICGDQRLRVRCDPWVNATRGEVIVEFEIPEGGYKP